MKNLGIARKLDRLGRITLPIELRRTIGIVEGDPLEMYVEGEMICLISAKVQPKTDLSGCTDEEVLEEIKKRNL